MRGTLFYQIGNYSQAIESIAKAIDTEPRYDTDLFVQAMAALDRGDHRRALAQLNELALTNVDDISIHIAVGKRRYRCGDYKGAVEAFEQALSLNSTYPDIRNWYGLALMGCGHNEKALEQFQQAIEINP